ncbi:F-box protein SKIP23 [Spinacia oleracea]|uniref:F-box protein SKIP23 n=1 Tax=Spinacia oleracea TaxID=3562 RepID=A0A9R0IIJ2_SPIOL|nr:F-box protein SKIP23-like [Spinacia oleracea]
MADWSELPSELLELISNLYKTSSNTRHFRSVCSYWRSSVLGKPSTHFLSPTIKSFNSDQSHDHSDSDLRLVKQTTFLLSLSSDPNSCWVIKTEENKPGLFRLFSPFSKRHFLNNLDRSILDLTNVYTFEIGSEYVLRNVISVNEKVAYHSRGNDSFTLLSIQNSTGKLVMYRSSSQEWAFLDDFALGYDDAGDFVYDWSLRYVDVAEYDGKYYAVTDLGRTVVIECEDDFSVEVNLMIKSITGGDKKCLVKSNCDLLLVDLYTCSDKGSLEVNAIDVFKLDKEEKRWVLLKSLGGCSIFLSNFSSLSTSTSLHGLKENCIYFSFKNFGRDFSEKKDGDDVDEYYDVDGMESSNIGVFEYDKGNFGSFEENFEDSKFLCWPPPSWVNLLT